MIDKQIIFAGRQEGKTYTIMHEIVGLVRFGGRADILIIFPAMEYLHWWQREWERLFPHVSMVDYTTLNNMAKVRGRAGIKHVFVEDIDTDSEGIYNEKFEYLRPCLAEDATITFTASPNPLTLRSHSQTREAAKAKARQAALLQMGKDR